MPGLQAELADPVGSGDSPADAPGGAQLAASEANRACSLVAMDTWPTALTMAERSTTTPEYCCMKRDFSTGSPSSIGVASDVPAPNRLSFESVESVLSRRNAPQPRGYGQGRDRTGDLPLFSYVVPVGDARACGKIGCGRSPRSSFLGAGEPFSV